MLTKDNFCRLVTQLRELDKLEQNLAKVLDCSISNVISNVINELLVALVEDSETDWTDDLYDYVFDRSLNEEEVYARVKELLQRGEYEGI